MSAARVIEVSVTSDKSFEDAINRGVLRATQTLRNVKSAWVKDQQVDVENGIITRYRVHLMITFLLNIPQDSTTSS
jgi:dodecin